MKSKLLLCILSFLFFVPLIANQFEVPATADNTPLIQVAQGEITSTAASIDLYSTSSIKAYILSQFPNAPVMADIASCESHFRQLNYDGSVLIGKQNSDDTGVFMINKKYHLKEATSLGLNLDIFVDNVAFAKVLYERNGTRDWNWSKYPIGKFQGWAQGECS